MACRVLKEDFEEVVFVVFGHVPNVPTYNPLARARALTPELLLQAR